MSRTPETPHQPPEQVLAPAVDRREQATSAMLDAWEVYLNCIEETLLSIEGIEYTRAFRQVDLDDDADDGAPSIDLTCVTFSIACNPAHNLTVDIQLRPEVFSLQVNGQTFEVRRKRLDDIVEWTEVQCQRVETLFRPNLKVQVNKFAGMPLRSEVSAAHGEKFDTIVKRQDGMATVFASVLPFGFALASEKAHVYNMWYHRVVPPEEIPPPPPGPESLPLDPSED